MNGEGLVLLGIPESWGRLSGEPTTACCCSCCIIHDNKLAKKVFLTVLPVATSLRSRLELVMRETLVAKSSHEIHTCNPMEAGRKADGRATIAPHEQVQFISVSFPRFNAPPAVGCCLATLPPCSTAALWFCCSPPAPSFAPGLGRAMLACAPSSLQAEILPLRQCLEAVGSHARKMRMRRTPCVV